MSPISELSELELASDRGTLLGEEIAVSSAWSRRRVLGAVGLLLFGAAALSSRSGASPKPASKGMGDFMQAQDLPFGYGVGPNGEQTAALPAQQAYPAQQAFPAQQAAQQVFPAQQQAFPAQPAQQDMPYGYGVGANGEQTAASPAQQGYPAQQAFPAQQGFPAQPAQAFQGRPAYGGEAAQPAAPAQDLPYGYGVGANGEQTAASPAQPAAPAQAAQFPAAQAAAAQAAAPAMPAAEVPAVAAPAEAAPAAEEPVQCSWEGENCADSKCCKRAGMTCWEKDQYWGSCSKSCDELSELGGDWSCSALGAEGAAIAAPPGDAEPASVSLFCFMVITPQGIVPPGVEEGYEQLLVDTMKENKLSIFACEASEVYEGARCDSGEWKSIKNTDIFVKVWRDVQGGGLWEQQDWTVKVDSDAVYMPDRLKMHIQGSKPPADTPIYFRNIDFKFHFMGALEVMNKKGVELFIANLDVCSEHIGNNGGEDIFTMSCLDAIGVNFMEDDSLLDDKYSNPEDFNLFDVDRCKSESIVAFHPYKAVNSWMGCYKVATGQVEPGQFTSCEHRHEDEACSLTSTLDHPGTEDGTGIVG